MSHSRLKLKIKIPPPPPSQSDDAIVEGFRVCEYCGKQFSSGKAWGGHKRHHLQEMKRRSQEQTQKLNLKPRNINNVGNNSGVGGGGRSRGCKIIKAGDVSIRNGKPRCRLCGKDFGSLSSVLSHLRLFHANNNNDHNGSIDLMGYLSGGSSGSGRGMSSWYRKEKRGRVNNSNNDNNIGASSGYGYDDPFIPQAALNLIILSRDTANSSAAAAQQHHQTTTTTTIDDDDDDDDVVVQPAAHRHSRLDIDLNKLPPACPVHFFT